jgi:DRTGG domain.
MKIADIVKVLEAEVITGADKLDDEVLYGFASDLLSDVLTVDSERMLLLTGMANLQTIRTAEMSEIICIVFVRDKKMSYEMIDLAIENDIVTIESSFSLFRAILVLHDNGLKPVF